MSYLLRRLTKRKKLDKVFRERLTEPLHLNVLAACVALFGSYRAKIDFDLIVRQQYAFPLLFAADLARARGLSRISVVEMGVAAGAGLLNMCSIAQNVTKLTNIQIDVFGFDTGKGMPPAVDYRDLPELYQTGDYPMDFDKLHAALPTFAKLLLGDLKMTIPDFTKSLTSDAPLGFVAVDVDYYSSAKQSLQVLTGAADCYLPMVAVYLDDIGSFACSPWTGEMLAVNEFNGEQELRKIAPFTLLRSRRIFKNTQWIDRMYVCHIHDHSARSPANLRDRKRVLQNEYIS